MVRQQFWDQRLPTYSHIEGVKLNWDAHIQTWQSDAPVEGLAFSPDGRYLASTNTAVRLLDASTGTHLMSLKCIFKPGQVVFSPNSQLLAAGSVAGVKITIWNTTTWKEVHTIKCASPIQTFAFSPDDTDLVCAMSNGSVEFWDVRSGVLQKTMTLSKAWPFWRSVTISSDLGLLVSSTFDDTITLWSLVTGTVQHIFDTDAFPGCSRVAFHPDSKHLAIQDHYTIFIWNTATYKVSHIIESAGHDTKITFSAQGHFLAAASSTGFTLWTIDTGSSVGFMEGKTSDVVFSSDDRYLATLSVGSTSRGRPTIKLWDLEDITLHNISPFEVRARSSDLLLFSPNGDLVVSRVVSNTAHVWVSLTGRLLRSFTLECGFLDIQFSPDSRLLACLDGSFDIWIFEIRSGIKRHLDEFQARSLRHPIVYSANSHLAAVCWNDNCGLNLHDTTTGDYLFSLRASTDPGCAITFSPNGSHIALLSIHGIVEIWNTKTRTRQDIFPGDELDPQCSLGFSPDGKILAYNDRKRIGWCDVSSGLQRHTLKPFDGRYKKFAFSPNSLLLATSWSLSGQGDKISVYNARTAQHQSMLLGHSGDVLEIEFLPDNSRIAVTSSDWTVGIWDTTTLMQLHILPLYYDAPEMTRVSHDGSIIAVASRDKTIRLWSTATGDLLQMIYYDKGFIQELELLPDEVIVSVSDAESGKLWDPWCTQTFKLSTHSYNLSPTSQSSVSERLLSEVSLQRDHCWVMKGPEKVIWVPPEYRPSKSLSTSKRGNKWIKRGPILFIASSNSNVIRLRLS